MDDIAKLPIDHPLRNTPLVGFRYKHELMAKVTTVTPSFTLAKQKITYNQLGEVWTNRTVWMEPLE